ncbi:hypothetical protein [Flavobacterium subsaxonicum]|uniref:Uncharacterized protein n=1 Tax=Flavobacterium subsaxonicum WB 4.1-42 = DSM 21790 TaxID=1121898 RepID=A0A0A2N2U5_9FLAO|nr:hypothetical protein [Flavobacterium subsaxonicum]KGO94775.1 hypothetical protein Q766_01285 [Flavobacterium subsaxonicum WB 4.1-42 = DSM 21790]
MKKLLLGALLAISFSITAQTTEKEVHIPLAKYDIFKQIKSINSFKDFNDITENVTEVYMGETLLYTRAETPQYILKIMADGEWQFVFKSEKREFYFRFPNGMLVGYEFVYEKDGSIKMHMFKNTRLVHEDLAKPAK